MNLLAFDTSTDSMSIAVARMDDGVQQSWQHSAPGGSLASAALIPAILDLMRQAGLQMQALSAICFGSGPGSFTGLRTACSVAQGLAFGAQVPVLAVDSLLAVAEEARHTQLTDLQSGMLTALLDARMDEMYACDFAFEDAQWRALQTPYLVRPESLIRLQHGPLSGMPWRMAGNVFAVYAQRVAAHAPLQDTAGAIQIAALPTASAMLRLAPQLLAAGLATSAEHALPVYVRDKVAQTTAERTALKAAALAATAL
jgi:tRNA threonylcarbamoyladenosine biosynthesis protein TsaB